MLPKPVAKWVARFFFWPTIPLTLLRKEFYTEVDHAIVLGHAPIPGFGHAERLFQAGVTGVVNLCDEYGGPEAAYRRCGIRQLYVPVVDHIEPDLDTLKRSVAFIEDHEREGGKVFIHCKGGHGRSASVAMAWLMYREPQKPTRQIQRELSALRKVRSRLHAQENIKAFGRWLDSGGFDVDGAAQEAGYATHRSAGGDAAAEAVEDARSRKAIGSYLRGVESQPRASSSKRSRGSRGKRSDATQRTPLLSGASPGEE